MISDDAGELARELERARRDVARLGLTSVAAGTTAAGTAAGTTAAGTAAAGSAVAPAEAAHRLAQALADAAAAARGEPPHPVPRLADHALADQVAVTGRELLVALGEGRRTDLSAVVAALDALRAAVRRAGSGRAAGA